MLCTDVTRSECEASAKHESIIILKTCLTAFPERLKQTAKERKEEREWNIQKDVQFVKRNTEQITMRPLTILIGESLIMFKMPKLTEDRKSVV